MLKRLSVLVPLAFFSLAACGDDAAPPEASAGQGGSSTPAGAGAGSGRERRPPAAARAAPEAPEASALRAASRRAIRACPLRTAKPVCAAPRAGSRSTAFRSACAAHRARWTPSAATARFVTPIRTWTATSTASDVIEEDFEPCGVAVTSVCAVGKVCLLDANQPVIGLCATLCTVGASDDDAGVPAAGASGAAAGGECAAGQSCLAGQLEGSEEGLCAVESLEAESVVPPTRPSSNSAVRGMSARLTISTTPIRPFTAIRSAAAPLRSATRVPAS